MLNPGATQWLSMAADPSQGAYGRWAGVYDVVSHHTPGLPRLRARAIQALDLEPGDTVIDLGCGAGPNIPLLRNAVGASGEVVGVDFTGPILERAREKHDFPNVRFIQADVTELPLDGAVDAIFASFLCGMLPDPTTTVDGWSTHVRTGGTLGLLDASLSDARIAWPANQVIKGMVFASSPEKSLDWETAPWHTVTRRVKLAHAEIRANASETTEQSWLLGTVRCTTGRID